MEEVRERCMAGKENFNDFTLADLGNFKSSDLFEVADYLDSFLQDAIEKGYMVYGNQISSAPSSEFIVLDPNTNESRKFLNFCSYNYLGYSCNPDVIKEVQNTLLTYGTGAVSAPLLSGYYNLSNKLEKSIAEFKMKEDAVIFPTGYATNLGVISCLLKQDDVAVLDILSHTSIYDGAKLAGANIKVFSHNNPKHLEKVLKSVKGKRVLVCVEGVYSMDGDIANLPEIVDVCKKYDAKILLDEAHSTLIFGENGAGVAEHFGVNDQIDISIGTFSKSFGAIGGFAAGDRKLINYIKMYANSYVFSCAMAPHTAAGILKVLEIYKNDKSERDKLWKNTIYMQDKLTKAGINIGETQSPIIPVMVGSDCKLKEISKYIFKEGLYTGVVRYPAVSNKRTRLRLSMSSNHTKEQMDKCVDIIKSAFDLVKNIE